MYRSAYQNTSRKKHTAAACVGYYEGLDVILLLDQTACILH